MSLDLKPSHASVKAYYDTLHQFGQLYIDHEGAVRSAFQDLLAKCGRKTKPQLTLVPEYRIERARSSVIVDGALVDLYHFAPRLLGSQGRERRPCPRSRAQAGEGLPYHRSDFLKKKRRP